MKPQRHWPEPGRPRVWAFPENIRYLFRVTLGSEIRVALIQTRHARILGVGKAPPSFAQSLDVSFNQRSKQIALMRIRRLPPLMAPRKDLFAQHHDILKFFQIRREIQAVWIQWRRAPVFSALRWTLQKLQKIIVISTSFQGNR
jgi:hypothetical protein